jgi:hypothetical protein
MSTTKVSLDDIAAKIHQVRRTSLFDIGALLLEANDQCEHGEWGEWLYDEFEWSADTADRYMKAAELASKFRKLRNLKLAKSTIYALADENEGDLPAVIAELTRHATKRQLRASDAEDVIAIGRARGRHGDFPDVTLREIAYLEAGGTRGASQIIEALKAKKPESEEAAAAVIDAIAAALRESDDDGGSDHDGNDDVDHGNDEVAKQAEQDEANAILDGPSPRLPPPASTPPASTPPASKELPPDAFVSPFREAVESLKPLATKSVARFTGATASDDLIRIADFLYAVAGRKPIASDEQSTPFRKLQMENLALVERIAELEARIEELLSIEPETVK